MAILRRARRLYKEKFNNKRFTAYPIYQSKPLQLNGKMYVLLGQATEKDSPIITNYQVYHEGLEVIDELIAKEVYYTIMIGLIIETIRPLKVTFQAYREHLHGKREKGIKPVSNQMVELFDHMQVLYEQAAKDQLKEKEYKLWIQAWQDFWALYKGRAQMFSRLPQNEVLTPLKKNEQKEKTGGIMKEARILAPVLYLRSLSSKADPLEVERWIQFNAERALASKRDVTISTEADFQSEQVMRWLFYIIIGAILSPLLLYQTYKNGLAYLFFYVLFIIIYFSLYYVNKNRLKRVAHLRLLDLWQNNLSEAHRPLIHIRAMSMSMGVSFFYVSLATIIIFGGFYYHFGWNGITIFTLVLMIFTISFNIWFLYSPFVEKDLTFYKEKVRAGDQVFTVKDIRQISVDKHDITYTFYLTHTNEPYDIYVEKKDRGKMTRFIEAWCERHHIPFKLYHKNDRDHM